MSVVNNNNNNNIIQTSSDSKSNDKLFNDAVLIIEHAQKHAYSAINIDLVKRNWLLGKRISETILHKNERADYGKETIKQLSILLSQKFGKGFDYTEVYRMMRVYNAFPDLLYIESTDSENINILETVFPKFGKRLLSWSHYCKLLQVDDAQMREWYANECVNEAWSIRTLQRNISTQYANRLLASKGEKREEVRNEMLELSRPFQNDPKEYIKNPIMLEFLGLPEDASFRESELENAIITNLQKFLIELGKGWAFMARQQHIQTEKQDYYIDLVFYNVMLKCYILIDLKTEKITYQDVGQMDMYVKMYDDMKRTDGDNPTLGIILCADTDEDVATYAMKDKDQLFASKYLTYLPSEEQLRIEIERQKTILALKEANK